MHFILGCNVQGEGILHEGTSYAPTPDCHFSGVLDLCILKNLQLGDAPSEVSAITLKSQASRCLIHSHTIGKRTSPKREVVGTWTYGNARLLNRPRTIKTSM